MRHRPTTTAFTAATLALLTLTGCGEAGREGRDQRDIEAESIARLDGVVGPLLTRAAQHADSIDDILHPVRLLNPAEESAFRRYVNQDHLARARALGVQPVRDSAAQRALHQEERLVRLPDSTEHWIVRELDHSAPLVVPDTRVLLHEIATRFQQRLDEMGLPPLRLEISSALRTAEQQAELRGSNVNAAAGTSTHQYGTTVDIAYNGFAAPQEPPAFEIPEAPSIQKSVDEVRRSMIEMVAARRSRELQAILGRVLTEMQDEGKVMVTLERQQPVYHVTVARRMGE